MAILTPVVLYPGTAGNPDVHDILKPTDSIKALPTGAAGGILSGTYPNPSINLTNCSGTAITAGTAMATCAEMGTAISTAIAAIPAADGSETKLVAGTNTSVTGTGTTANPFVVNALPDATKADLVGGVVPASQLPSFVDDVLEFPTLAGFPATGEAGKIYIDAATSKTYRWSGTTYVSLSSNYAVVARDEGTVLTTVMTDINFTGGGVTASNVGGTVTVNVPAGASTLPPSGAAGGILSGTYPNPSINLTNCSGTAITAGTAMATCAEMGTAISTAIAAIPAADGSETKLVAGTNTSVTGTGTTANPFVVNALPDATKADLVGGVVPASQLPSFVDDVLEFPTLAGFPATGEAGKIYIDASTSKTYRWSGTTYVPLGGDYALTILDEGNNLTTTATSMNFTGAGVTATNIGGAVTVIVPSGSPTRTTGSIPPASIPVGNIVGSIYVDTVMDEEWTWDGARWNLLRGYATVLRGANSGPLEDVNNELTLVTWTPPRANMALSVSGDIYFTWADTATVPQDFKVHLTLRKNGFIIAGQTITVDKGRGSPADYWATVSIAYVTLGDPAITNNDISLDVQTLEPFPAEPPGSGGLPVPGAPSVYINTHTLYIHAVA